MTGQLPDGRRSPLFSPALLMLAKLRLKGGWRRVRRSLSTPKGILLTLVSLAFFGLILAPQFIAHRLPREAIPAATWFLHPAALLAFFLVSIAGGRVRSPIAFTMPEVAFLFPGPFERRQLLAYKLATSAVGTLGFSAMMTLFLSYLWWAAALLGLWLTTTFILWSAILAALVMDWLGERFRYLRFAAVAAALAAVAASLWQAGLFEPGLDVPGRLSALESSWAGRIAMAPFVAPSRALGAETLGDLLPWAAAVLAMIGGVALSILRLDSNFLEASLVASQKRYEMLKRVRRSGGMPTFAVRSRPRFDLPRFPRLLGAGPIAWRQSLDLVRGSARLIFIVPALAGPFVALTITGQRHGPSQMIMTLFMTMFIAFLVSMMTPLGVRTELDHVDAIKPLPFSAGAIVGGSVAAAVLYLFLIQAIAAAALSAIMGRWTLAASLALALALPVDLLLVASDGLLVILFPSIRRLNPGDLLAGMRMTLVNLAKMLFAVLAAGIGGLGALVPWLIWGDWREAIVTAGWIVLVGEGLACVWLAARLFERYDASAHLIDHE